MVAPAPGRFSIITGWRSAAERWLPTSRPTTSTGEPAVSGTMILIGLLRIGLRLRIGARDAGRGQDAARSAKRDSRIMPASQSTFMPLDFTTAIHFGNSSISSVRKSCGVPPSGAGAELAQRRDHVLGLERRVHLAG